MTSHFPHRLAVFTAAALCVLASQAQQPPANGAAHANPTRPQAAAQSSAGATPRQLGRIGVGMLVGAGIAAWWAHAQRPGAPSTTSTPSGQQADERIPGIQADPRTDALERELEEKRRVVDRDSNGAETTTQKDRDGHIVEKRKVDADGAEVFYESYVYEGEICVFEQHMERLSHGPNRGGHRLHIVRRRSDGTVVHDEKLEFDKDGNHTAGTRTTVGADGSSRTEVYERETNRWK